MKNTIRHITCSITMILCSASLLSAQSPYSLSWEKDGYILGIGGTAAATGYFLYRSVEAPTTSDITLLARGSVNQFDRSATYHFSGKADKASDIIYGIAIVAPSILFTDKTLRDDWKTITFMYLETWLFIGGTSMLSKGLVERYRPYVYNPDVPVYEKLNSDAKMSFFSNHATTAFASALFFSTVYSDYHPHSKWTPYIWTGSLLAASFVGYLRYEAGMHYPSDILIGAVVGSAIGYIIPWIHRVDDENISLIPYAPSAQYGITMQVRF
jgi:membrane-associated phospholipid phosphatase